jgi:hypothetical protein
MLAIAGQHLELANEFPGPAVIPGPKNSLENELQRELNQALG